MYVIFNLQENYQNYTYNFTCGVIYNSNTATRNRLVTEAVIQSYNHQKLLEMLAAELLRECLVELNIEENTAKYTEAFEKAAQAFEQLTNSSHITHKVMSNMWGGSNSSYSPNKEGHINGVGVSKIARRMPGYDTEINCPVNNCFSNSGLGAVIIHLNDEHGWTRECIADWLDEQHDAGRINIEFDSEPIDTNNIKSPDYYYSYDYN